MNAELADGGNLISGSLAFKGAASLTLMRPSGGGGTEEIKLMSGNGGSGGGWALTLCGGADISESGALTPSTLVAGRTPGPPGLGCKTPLDKLDGGRLLGGKGKCLDGTTGGTAGGDKLTSAFGANLLCVGFEISRSNSLGTFTIGVGKHGIEMGAGCCQRAATMSKYLAISNSDYHKISNIIHTILTIITPLKEVGCILFM